MSKHEPLSAEWLRKYRQGELSEDDRVRLEVLRTQDPFLADALAGIEKLSSDEYATDVSALRKRLAQRQSKRNRVGAPWWAVAASLVGLFIASFLLYTFLSPPAAEPTSDTPVADESTEALAFRPEAPQDDQQRKMLPPKQQATSDTRASARSMNKVTEPVPDPASGGEESPEENAKALTYAKEAQTSQDFAVGAQQKLVAEQLATSQDRRSNENESAAGMSDSQPPPTEVSSGRKPIPESTSEVLSVTVASGLVVDEETSAPLPGVNVLLQGSTTGTVTDVEGRFSLAIPADPGLLTFHAIGYSVKEMASSGGDTTYVSLTPDIQALSEVVVVGYGHSRQSSGENAFKGAQPVGGMRPFRRYLRDSLRYPTDWSGKTVTVQVRFEVGADGTLRDFSIPRSGGEWFDQEAIRIIKEGPVWTAAERGDERVAQTKSVRIKFKALR